MLHLRSCLSETCHRGDPGLEEKILSGLSVSRRKGKGVKHMQIKDIQYHETDLLIIGGACSGLTCAITAKEQDERVKVLIADKACASKGWAGKAARTAGLLSFVSKDNDPEEFVRYCVNEIGGHLNDQHLLREFAYNSRRIVKHLEKWGVEFEREEDGQVAVSRWPFPWVTAGIDPDMCRSMSAYAKKLGTEFLDYVVITGLLKTEGRVCGACGFHIRDGSFHVIRSLVTVLACGSQNFDITPNWCSTGVSQLLAYEAGAKMRNVEFCGMGDFARVGEDGQIYYGALGGAHTAHDHLYAKGENISQKWRPGFHSSMDPYAANAWYRETLAGNGPVYANMKEFFQGEEGVLFHFHPEAFRRDMRLQELAHYPFDKEVFQVIPGVISEMSAIYVDNQMNTSVSCLLAVGDASGSGSARAGAVPAPPAKIHGTGLMNAFFMGEKGGRTAVTCVNLLKRMGLSCDQGSAKQEEQYKNELDALLNKTDGISPRRIIHRVQDAMAACDYIFVKEASRLEEALDMILEAKEMLPRMRAEDYHELSKCIDAKAMVLCGEMFFRTSLMRTESRGFHYREDYPDTSEQWQKWILVSKDGDQMRFELERVKTEQYDYP